MEIMMSASFKRIVTAFRLVLVLTLTATQLASVFLATPGLAVAAPLFAPGGVTSGLRAWYKADDGTATGAAWSDQSGNSNTMISPAGSQPVLDTGAGGLANFNPYFTFDGTDDYYDSSTFRVDPSNSTIVVVGRSTNFAASSARNLVGGGAVGSPDGMEFSVSQTGLLNYLEGAPPTAVNATVAATINQLYLFGATQTNLANGVNLYPREPSRS
jgi:hypothetical protein